ncbi:hypothetical protein [Streptomyces marianii]|uniref:Uncharacterized protein n=1 Tax=Streptomyces marianii TaxID=1817406 RepID=A0A5R9E704_9ACTN|nr:hypothetical protein [Streptomyces marianii]TLQ44679.1 hypothetical protein FEF34_17655 [Streptomyces marianii]
MRSTRLTALRESGRRIGTVALGAAAVLGLLTTPAQASSWSSYLSGVGPGYESRRWYDTGGATTIKFTGCSGGSGAEVRLRKDTFGPDPAYSTALFTNCFASSTSTSTGNWSDHGSGDYYFAVNEAAVSLKLSVKSLTVSY